MDRLHFAREIARLKVDEALSWPQVAETVGLSQATCQRLFYALRDSGDVNPPEDAWTWVYEHRDALTIAMEHAARTYEAAPAGSSAAIGAIKQWIAASEKRLELATAVGWAPRQLGALSAERAMQELLKEMAAIAERYDAPDEMVQAFLDLAERRLTGRPATIEGQAVTAT